MLAELTISNFAIIDRLHVTLSSDFTVLTGETGAGKSIIVDALDALLGGKYGAEFVRTGAESARIEGIFTVPSTADLVTRLAEFGLETDDETLILSREIHSSGRSTARVNGRAVPNSVLQEIAQALLDIHGQSEHLSLLRVSEHINVLDRYAGVGDQRAAVAERVAHLRAVRRELQNLLADERDIARRVDLLRYQIDEINAAGLRQGEEEELQRERTLLSNAEKLAALCEEAYALLYDGSDAQRSAIDLLGQAGRALDELARLDARLQEHTQAIAASADTLSDIAHALRAYRDGIEFNPQRLQDVEERLALMQSLKRKYGPTLADVAAFAERAARELDAITHSEEREAELREQEQTLLHDIGARAAALSAARRRAAEDIARRLEHELADLNMRHVRFQVSITNAPADDGVIVDGGELPAGRYACDATGIDRVEFLISPNPGEPLKPLARVASGGETARVMLALKSILSATDDVPTLIFDEIDVGIGGRSGYVVGEKLWRLTPRHQVICITHLPQVAAYGDHHFTVVKEVVGEQTRTRLREMMGEERVQEIAAMLGSTSDLSKDNAREMLRHATEWKRSMARAPSDRP